MNLLASSGQLRASFLRWALVCVPVIVLLGFLSGKVAQSGPDNPWFAALTKPAAYPPPALFGIVWTILYVLMGIALALVLSARGARGRGAAAGVFAVQFALNLFGMHLLTASLIVIGLLDVLVIVTIALFGKVRPVAAMLLIPYLAWVLFATYLNFAFWQANPTMDGVDGGGAVVRYEI